MKTNTKIGLATSAVYTATSFALPALVAAKEEPKPVPVETISLKGVDTVKDARTLFYEKLTEYSEDKELNFGEIRNLSSVLAKEKELLNKTNIALSEDHVQADKKISEIYEKRVNLEGKLEGLKETNNAFLNYLIVQREKVEGLLEKTYPGMLDKENTPLNLSFSPYLLLPASLQPSIKQIIISVHNMLSLDYKDSSLKHISEKKVALELIDVAELLKIIANYESTLINAQNDLASRKKELEQDIKALKSQESAIQKKLSESKVETAAYLEAESNIIEKLEMFSNYLVFKDRADEFIKRFGSRNEYWSFSLLENKLLDNKAKSLYRFLVDKSNKVSIEKTLDNYLQSQGLEAKVTSLKNPLDRKFSMWWIVLVNGLMAPMMRNILIRGYMGGGNEDKYLFSALAGCGNGIFGLLVIDGLHPLAFWARMASPVLIQPLKRAFKLDW